MMTTPPALAMKTIQLVAILVLRKKEGDGKRDERDLPKKYINTCTSKTALHVHVCNYAFVLHYMCIYMYTV